MNGRIIIIIIVVVIIIIIIIIITITTTTTTTTTSLGAGRNSSTDRMFLHPLRGTQHYKHYRSIPLHQHQGPSDPGVACLTNHSSVRPNELAARAVNNGRFTLTGGTGQQGRVMSHNQRSTAAIPQGWSQPQKCRPSHHCSWNSVRFHRRMIYETK
jgi:hypothetical protein